MTAMLARDVRPILAPVLASRPDADLSLDDLGSRIVGMAGRIAAATAHWLTMVADFDRRAGCARFGLPSTARWLSFACGLAHRTAVEHVRVARALAAFPVLADAMTDGALSYSHARAISRLADPDDPADRGVVADLVELAKHATIGQLETTVRGLRTVDDNERAETSYDDALPEQYFSHAWTDRSQWRCHARLDPENGALVHSVLETIARRDDIPMADALLRMAEIALAAVNDASPAPRPLRGDERAAVVIHLDAAAVPSETTDAEPTDVESATMPPARSETGPRSAERAQRPFARIADGPGLPSRVALRLLCAGRIRTAVHDEQGNVRDLGRSHRVVDARLFRALLMRDGGCTHPGCASRAALEAHHVRHWLYGGTTAADNLVLLCRRHHHAHHDGEFTITPAEHGTFRFRRADARELQRHIDPGRLRDRPESVADEYRSVAPDAARGRWLGDRLDRRYVVSVLAGRRRRATPAS